MEVRGGEGTKTGLKPAGSFIDLKQRERERGEGGSVQHDNIFYQTISIRNIIIFEAQLFYPTELSNAW